MDGNDPAIMTSLAAAYLRTNSNEPAKELLTTVIKMQPDNGTAYKYLGYCCLQLGHADKSIENYNKAIEINDKDWDAHRGLGVACILKGKNQDGTVEKSMKDEAVKHWRLSLDLRPDQPNSDKLIKLIRAYSK